MSSIVVAGDTSGSITLSAPATSGSSVLTLPVATDTLVGKATTDTLTNKTLTAPVIATIVNTGTLTLPTSTDTLVGKATTDTLTNKSIVATQLTGTIAAARLPAGSVLQVVNSVIFKTTHVTTTSTSWSAMGAEFQASITPLSASSKIVILANITSYTEVGYGWYRIDRAISGLADVDLSGGMGLGLGAIDADRFAVTPLFWVDSPNTTSQITYKIMMLAGGGTFYAYHNDNKTQFILMEIAA